MQRIPLTARAECVDGPCGGLSGLVVRADSRTLEYYVVRDNTPNHAIERLVARTRVSPSDVDVVRLDCTLAELEKMQPLNEQQYGLTAPPKHGGGNYGLVDAERAPDGTGVLRLSQVVEARNGKVGKLSGVVVDDAGLITHFYTLLDKHGSAELFLPASAVWYVDRFTVYLHLDKQQLESLPTLPALVDKTGQPAHKHMELVARVYDTPGGAADALEHLREAQGSAAHPINIAEAAVLVRQGDAAPTVQDKGGQSNTAKGVAMGVAAGGLLAMLGPIGLVAGAVAGGAVGGFAGSRHLELGFPEAFLKKLQEQLKPDHSALVILIERNADQDPAELQSVLDGALSHEAMVDTLVQEMLAAEHPEPATAKA
jgi:uncharacterized membrane protein